MRDLKRLSRYGVILAGGLGERFWPLSRVNRPKQLLCLTHPSKSMLTEAVERLAPIIPPDRMMVVTGRHLVDAVREASTGVSDDHVIGEPCKRNTAGALAYTTARLLAAHPRTRIDSLTLAVLTADHFIADTTMFRSAIETALHAAEEHQALVVCGIHPSRPETGFGYLEIPDNATPVTGAGSSAPVYPVAAFREKPTLETARDYLATRRHFWNSGMFFWRVSTFMSELEAAQPRIAASVYAMSDAIKKGDEIAATRLFESLPDISIDYALMERARNVLMVKGSFDWQYVGSWSAVEQALPRDSNGNCLLGGPVVEETSDCLIYNGPGSERIAVGVLGAKGLAIIVTEDGILVMPKDRAQDVRAIVARLRERNAPQL